jgi:hypothetical protein
MTVRMIDQGVIELTGRCGADEAEVLQHQLLAAPGAVVEWTRCEHLHSAVIQVLLAAGRLMQGTPNTVFLADFIAPILTRSAVRHRTAQGLRAASQAAEEEQRDGL